MIPKGRALLVLVALVSATAPYAARADWLTPEQLYFHPAGISPDFYPRVGLPNLQQLNYAAWMAGGDPVMDADILPVLKPGDYGPNHVFGPSDYYLTPNVDYRADLSAGSLTAWFETPGIYHVRVTRRSGAAGIYAVFAESGLKEDEGKPNKTGAEKALKDTVPGTEGVDLMLVEERDSTMDASAEVWGKYGLGDKVQRITSRADAVKKIRDKYDSMNPKRKLHVEIDGHGNEGYASMGGGWKKGKDYYMDLDNGAQEFATAIKEYVSRLTFQGCSVGAGTAGAKFLDVFRNTLGDSGAWDQPVSVHDKSRFSVPPNAAFVPEPATVALLLLGGLAALRRAA